MTPLADILIRRIRNRGGLTLADYMSEVLTHPRHGYYSKADPFGARGDFVTAPEISQMFGELIGLWCADTWQRLGKPRPLLLVELGPGRGSLMADALRALRLVPDLLAACELHLVEMSPVLRARQAEALAGASAAAPVWHDNLGEVPEGAMILVANEFFDALPVRQFERTTEGWCERLVVVDPQSDPAEPALAFALSAPSSLYPKVLPAALRDAPPGALVEVSLAGLSIAQEIGRRVAAQPGAALIIDYGHADHRTGGTLQALRRHAAHEVLREPGSADLTAHVDFAALAAAAADAGAGVHGPVPQGLLLERLGIAERAEALQRGATPRQAEALRSAKARLTEAAQMGELFKALALTAPGLELVAGFA